jgi:solute carrier family 35 protein F5
MMRARAQHCWKSLSRRALGLLCLAGVILIWVVSAETIQFIFRAEAFSSPFFLTYFNTGLFALYLFGFLFRPQWWGEAGPPRWMVWLRRSPLATSSDASAEALLNGASSNKDHEGDGETAALPERFTLRQVLLVALGFCPLWFSANYFYNLSLTLTSASSATILSSTSSLFTFCLGWVMRVEQPSLWKGAGVLLTLGGVVLVSLTDTSSASSSRENVAGDLVALVGAACYACYAVYLKVRIADERALHMPMFFGFVGALNLLLFWPLGFVLHYTRVEPFAWPSPQTLGVLFANGLVGTVLR